jgi:hypothetical protein
MLPTPTNITATGGAMPIDIFTKEGAERVNRAIVPVRAVEAVRFRASEGAPMRGALLVRIDASERPDLVDLMRVVRQEGLQQRSELSPIYETQPGYEALIQYVAISDPVEVEFTIVLPWAEYEQSLRWLAEAQFLLVATGDEDLAGQSIGLRVHGPDLQRAIALWEGKRAQK